MNFDATSALSQAMTTKIGTIASGKNMTQQQADVVSKDFESLFISQMLEQMFGESIGSSAFGTTDTDEVYKSLMVQEYGKIITKSGGIGIATKIYGEIYVYGEIYGNINSNVKSELLKQQEI